MVKSKFEVRLRTALAVGVEFSVRKHASLAIELRCRSVSFVVTSFKRLLTHPSARPSIDWKVKLLPPNLEQ